jgi:hypothetical protein
MASTEQTEGIVGAGLLGVPVFDFFVWALDNYARAELLVRLYALLPSFLTSPVTIFLCLCGGLALLYLSGRRQLQRVATASAATGKLVDTSGTQIATIEKPKWLLPVIVVGVLALIAAPIVTIAYSLAYKGPSPTKFFLPKPPYFAYAKTAEPKVAAPQIHIEQHSQAPNSPNVVGNSNQFNYSYEPFSRALNDSQIATLKANLASAQPIPFWLIIETPDHQSPGRESSDEQGVFSNQLASVLVAAGWEDKEDECDKSTTPCPQPNPGYKYEEVTHHGIVITTPPELLDWAKKLSAEFNRLLFRNVIRNVERYRADMPNKLDVIIVEVGTS